MTRKRFLKSMMGKSLEVVWLDPSGYVQSRLEECVPSLCKTQGVLVKNELHYVVLASSQYANDEVDKIVDATAITKGCVQSIKELVKEPKHEE